MSIVRCSFVSASARPILVFAACSLAASLLLACGGSSGGGATVADVHSDDTTDPTDATDAVTPDSAGADVSADPCADVTCPAQPCKVNGRCTAESAPSCVYDDAADDSACDLVGAGDGVCEAGACVAPPIPCETNQGCGDFAWSCVGGFCAPRGVAGATCDLDDDFDCTGDHLCVEAVCLGIPGAACDDDDLCVDNCHEGFCTSDQRFGGPCNYVDEFNSFGCLPDFVCGAGGTCLYGAGAPCTDSDECGGGATCSDTKGTCVLPMDSPCTDDDQCVVVCNVLLCTPRSGFMGSCGETSDCEEDLACEPSTDPADPWGECRLANGTEGCAFAPDLCLSEASCVGDVCVGKGAVGDPCSAEAPCVSTARCADGVCAPLSEIGGPCGGVTDCAVGVCEGGTCLLPDGSACTDNDECVHTCAQGTCGDGCLTCACDDEEDCDEGLACRFEGSEGVLTCRYELGTPCLFDGPDSLCVNGTCTAKQCGDASELGGPCLDSEDCAAGLGCATDNTCRLLDGAACAANAECVNTCIGQVCSGFLGFEGVCDGDDEDCGPGLACYGTRCLSADPGVCGCRTFQGQCVGTINDDCNPGFVANQVSPCACPTACACVPD